MIIELVVRNGRRTVVALRAPAGGPPRSATHVRVADRGEAALGWNRIYATLVAQARQDGQADPAAAVWAQQIMLALGQIDGVQPAAATLADLKYLLANLATLARSGPSNVVLAENLTIEPILDDLDARERDLGDPYSPVDEPDPFFAETFFTEATRALREGRYEGWWSPIGREASPVGAPGGPGKLEALGPSSLTASEPLLGSWSELGIDGTHRLTYIGQDRILDWIPAKDSSRYRVWAFDRSALAGDPALFPLVEQPSWRTITADHELIWLGRDLQADPHSTEDLVLDWAPATGDYRLYRVDLEGTKEDGTTPDILPEPPLARGNWKTIHAGRKLIYLGGNRVLDWESATGNFRICTLNRGARGANGPNNDPLPTQEVQGSWPTIGEGHRIINLGGDRVLTWLPETGAYRVWRYDRSVRGTGEPLVSPPVVEGIWHDVDDGHELSWLGGRHVLDWQADSSTYRIRNHDRTIVSGDPLP
jgi:hypothetical protein